MMFLPGAAVEPLEWKKPRDQNSSWDSQAPLTTPEDNEENYFEMFHKCNT
jgi:hypothetical protein